MGFTKWKKYGVYMQNSKNPTKKKRIKQTNQKNNTLSKETTQNDAKKTINK